LLDHDRLALSPGNWIDTRIFSFGIKIKKMFFPDRDEISVDQRKALINIAILVHPTHKRKFVGSTRELPELNLK
jgi:hypothetical protein